MWLMKVKESQQFQFFASYAIDIHANECSNVWACDTAFYAIICYYDIKYTRTFVKSRVLQPDYFRNLCAYCVLLVHHSIPTKTVGINENNLHTNTLHKRSVLTCFNSCTVFLTLSSFKLFFFYFLVP